MSTIGIMLAVNSPDTGVHTGQVRYIHIGDLMEMEGPPLVCRVEKGRLLRLGEELFQHDGYRNWVGNWCWDRVVLKNVYLLRFLRVLMDNGWECVDGMTVLFDAWASGRVPDVAHLAVWQASPL